MGELAAALATLQTKLPHILKDSAAIIQSKEGGRAYGYKYADLASITKALMPLLGELGLSFTCTPNVRDDGKFVLRYALQHATDSDTIEGAYPLPTGTPQQIGSAITYARRYCLCAVTGAVADEDDDGQEAGRADGLPVNADGSLSRSRTTDEEKAAAGVMTSAQQAEHTQLAKTPPNTRPVYRNQNTAIAVDAAVDDPWMDGPAGLAPQDDPEDRPSTATAEQIKFIKTLYTAEFKITDRAAQIETTRKFLGIDMLSSHTQLSYRQAGDLLLAMRTKLKAAK